MRTPNLKRRADERDGEVSTASSELNLAKTGTRADDDILAFFPYVGFALSLASCRGTRADVTSQSEWWRGHRWNSRSQSRWLACLMDILKHSDEGFKRVKIVLRT